MDRPSSLVAKGKSGYTTRVQQRANNAAAAAKSAKSDDVQREESSEDSVTLRPRSKKPSPKASVYDPTCKLRVRRSYHESTDDDNDDESEQEAAKPPARNEREGGNLIITTEMWPLGTLKKIS
jgi:hypothetical protein